MKVYTEFFHTESEAGAFVRGVELAKDADMAVCAPRLQEGFEDGEENAWVVAVHDGGLIMEDDTCPLCGACDSVEANDGAAPSDVMGGRDKDACRDSLPAVQNTMGSHENAAVKLAACRSAMATLASCIDAGELDDARGATERLSELLDELEQTTIQLS